MAAARAITELGADGRSVKLIAADAVEGGLAALALEAEVIATVIVIPQREEPGGHEHAVENGAGGEIEHAEESGRAEQSGARISRSVKFPIDAEPQENKKRADLKSAR